MEEQRGNESYELVLIIEEAQTMLQRVLSRMITDLIQRQTVGQQAKKIINDCLTKLKENGADNKLISEAERGLQGSFLRWYESTTTQLLQMAQKGNNPLFYLSYKHITGITPKADSKAMVINLMQVEGYEEGSIENIRDYFTTGEKGYSQMFIDDYQKRVNKEIHNIASRNVILRDSRNRRMSVRNLAEMEVRFQELIKDQERLKAKGVEYAYATSHSNASKRCSIWQGKLFILDGAVGTTPLGNYIEGYSPKPKGKIDGVEYYSLADAIGHGFLGYNCRHRMIAYRKGMTAPREYPAKFVDIERKREGYLRSLENQIRHAKRDYLLTDDKEQRKDLLSRSKALQELYESKCNQYNYPIAEWRTRVSRDERNELPILENGGEISYQEYMRSRDNNVVSIKNNNIKTTKIYTDYNIEKVLSKYKGNDTIVKNAFENAVKDNDTLTILNNINKLADVTIKKGAKPHFQAGFNELVISNNRDISAFYHEYGHSIDNLVAFYKDYETEGRNYKWLSENIDNVRISIKNDWAVKDKVPTIPEDFMSIMGSETKRIVNTVVEKYVNTGKLQDEINKTIQKKYGNNWNRATPYQQKAIIADLQQKQVSKYVKEFSDNDPEYKKWSCLSDIYDAITSGYASNSKGLIAKHGLAYYQEESMVRLSTQGNVHKENTEIFANYVEMRLGNYSQQLEWLKTKMPKLNSVLEETYSLAAEILENGK